MLILNPNPCIDLTLWVNTLVVGSVHRATKNETSAGGKGINVSRAARTLGATPRLFLMLPLQEGDFYKELLATEDHDVNYLDVAGEVRKAIINKSISSEITVINGQGPDISSDDWKHFCEASAARTSENELVLMMGSLPNKVPENALQVLVQAIHNAGGRLLIDTAPAGFLTLKGEIVDFISPNLEEAEALNHGTSGDLFIPSEDNIEERAMSAAEKLFNVISKNVIVTAGKFGCAFKNADQHWWLPAYVISPERYKSAVGAGDSWVAGFASYVSENPADTDWKSAVRFGMASGASSTETFRAGGIDKARVLELLGAEA